MRPFFRKRSSNRNHLNVHKTFVSLSTSVKLWDPFSKHVSKPLFKNSDLTRTRPLSGFTWGLIILISTCFGLYIKHVELWISTSTLKGLCVGTRREAHHSQNCLPGKEQGYYPKGLDFNPDNLNSQSSTVVWTKVQQIFYIVSVRKYQFLCNFHAKTGRNIITGCVRTLRACVTS